MKTQINLSKLSNLPIMQRLGKWAPLGLILLLSWLLPAAKRAARPYVQESVEQVKAWSAQRRGNAGAQKENSTSQPARNA